MEHKNWQLWFNKVVYGLRAQGWAKSGVEKKIPLTDDVIFTCKYRGLRGAKCALGHLLTDEVAYEADRRNMSPYFLVKMGLIDGSSMDDDYHFLWHMQRCHDSSESGGNLELTMKDFGVKYGLDWPEDRREK